MKKNKKLFAILTLVAFMMTLMPVMAFAAATFAVSVTNNGDTEDATVTVTLQLDAPVAERTTYAVTITPKPKTAPVTGELAIEKGEKTGVANIPVEKAATEQSYIVTLADSTGTPVGSGQNAIVSPSKAKINEA